MFENRRKSLIQQSERSELRLQFEWTKVNQKCQKWSILSKFVVKQCYQTGQIQLDKSWNGMGGFKKRNSRKLIKHANSRWQDYPRICVIYQFLRDLRCLNLEKSDHPTSCKTWTPCSICRNYLGLESPNFP